MSAQATQVPGVQTPGAADSKDGVFRDSGPGNRVRARSWWRTNKFWVVCAAVFVVLSLIAFFAAGSGNRSSATLSITNPAPAGARAAAEVLRGQGVNVTAMDSLAVTTAALDANGAGRSTVLFNDPQQLLSTDQVGELAAAVRAAGGRLVAIAPGPLAARALDAGISSAGTASASPSVQAGCSNADATAAQTIDGGAASTGSIAPVKTALQLYTGVQTCFVPDGTGSGGYLAMDGTGSVAAVGNPGILINQNLASRGNAALAFRLLGSTPELLWYTASLKDVPVAEQPPSLADFTPTWIFPATAWLMLVALIGMLWKGRRNGPLVTEPLPVVVKASETLAGRARLYQDARASGTAGRTLQHATLTRLAHKLRLGHTADPAAVVDAVAAATGRNQQQVTKLLLGAAPNTDKDMMNLAVELAALEEEVARR